MSDHTPPAPLSSQRPWRSRLGALLKGVWNRDTAFWQRIAGVAALLGILLSLATLVVALLAWLVPVTPVDVALPGNPGSAVEADGGNPCSSDDGGGSRSLFVACVEGRRFGDDETVPVVRTSPVSYFGVQVYFENLSGSQQNDVVVRIELSERLKALRGSSVLFNSNGGRAFRDGVTEGGVIIGGYLPGGNAWIRLMVMTEDPVAYVCGENAESVTLITTTGVGEQSSVLPVTVTRADC
ncbi:hypothetical protein [Microbacterium sp.]|uniref:hypothetical protein n=1 Tax=Microbacterium sp. TaxID=51671 RepID=UPI003242DABA